MKDDSKSLYAMALVLGLGGALFQSFSALYFKKQWNASPLSVGLLLSVPQIAWSLLGIYGADLCHKLSAQRLLVASLGFNAALSLFLHLPLWHVSVAVFLLMGLNRALYEPAWQILSCQVANTTAFKTVLTRRFAFSNLGHFMAPSIGVFIVQWIGVGAPFILCTLAWVLVAFFVKKVFHQENTNIPTGQEKKKVPKNIVPLFKEHPALFLHILAGFFMGLVFSQLWSTLPLYAESQIGIGLWGFARFLSVKSLTVICVQFFASSLMEKCSSRTWLILSGVLYAVGALLLLSTNVHIFLSAAVLLGLGEALSVPAALAYLKEISGESHTPAPFVGAYQLKYLGFAAGPIFGGLMLQTFGFKPLCIFSSLAGLAAGAIYLVQNKQTSPSKAILIS